MMSRKIKGFAALDSKASVEDVKKATLKHRSLLQDYEELQKEVNAMRSRLETAKNKKLILAAEVRFLRKRHRFLVETKPTPHSTQEQSLEHAPTPPHKPKAAKKMPTTNPKEASAGTRILPSSLFSNPKKRVKVAHRVAPRAAATNRARKEPNGHSFSQSYNVPVSDSNHRESRPLSTLDSNQKQRASTRNPFVLFDLNKDGAHVGREEQQPSPLKAPIFDLNEISTGDEELYSNANVGNELELKVSLLCRNSGGEAPSSSSSRVVGKRKISWQDPVALRV